MSSAVESFQDFLDFDSLPIVGREVEIEQLQSALDKTRQEQQRSGIALVDGASGTGKSHLIRTALQCQPNTYWCSGKFEQHRRSDPYSAIVDAFSELCDSFMDHESIQRELNQYGMTVLPDMIPGVAKLMKWSGFDRSMSSLGQNHEWNSTRIKTELKQFLQLVCHPSKPCIVFIDDLQWADTPSLELLQYIVSGDPIQGLFLCGAFRNNEIDPTSTPLMELQEMTNVVHIHLNNLHLEQINTLIAFLLDRNDPVETMELSEIVTKRTEGNAFYVIQFLRNIQDEGYLHFSPLTLRFEWCLDQIQSETSVSNNVISLMQKKMERLPTNTREILKVAACLGSRFDLQIVEEAFDNCSEIQAQIQVAVDEGLVDKRRRSSRFKFAHDQIQLAAYLQIPEGVERLQTHLRIGRLLKTMLDKGDNSLLYTATEQLNKGSSLMTVDQEKLDLAWLNLRAAQSACRKSAFSLASTFLKSGLSFVDDATKWSVSYEFTLTSMTLLSQMEYCIGNREDSRSHIKEVLQHCKTLDEKLPLYIIQMESLASEGFDKEATKVGTETLRLLGEPIPRRVNLCNVVMEYWKTHRLLMGKCDEDLLALPELKNSRKLMALKIMSLLGGYAYTANQPLLIVMLGLKEMILILRSGLSKFSAEAFATFGILSGQMGNFDVAFRYGNLAQSLAAKYKSRHHNARSLLAVHFFLWHLRRPAHESIEPLLKAHRLSMENGDIRNAAFSFFSYIYCYISCGLPLGPVIQDTKKFRLELGDHAQDLMYKLTSVAYQTLLNLVNVDCKNPLKLTGSALDEDLILKETEVTTNTIVAQNIYLQKAILANYFVDFKLAGEMAEKIWKHENNLLKGCDFTSTGVTYFVLGLSALGMRRVPGINRHYQRKSQRYSRKYTQRLKQWVTQSEPNVYHMYLILLAEEAALSKEKIDFVKSAYDKAIRSALRSGFLQNAALAEERCALFFFDVGDTDNAEYYLRQSYCHYDEWGSAAKLQQLNESYNFLRKSGPTRRLSTARFGRQRYDPKASEQHRDTSTFDFIGSCDSSVD